MIKSSNINNALIQEITVELNKIENLSRILIECLRNCDNLKDYDTENLVIILESKNKRNKI